MINMVICSICQAPAHFYLTEVIQGYLVCKDCMEGFKERQKKEKEDQNKDTIEER